MQLIVKTRGSQPIDAKDKKWAEVKFKKLQKFLPAEAVVEITLEDMYGPKRGIDKKVHVLAELPHVKEPFHLEESHTNFRRAITVARDRFLRYAKKYHERHMGNRYPRKYWLSKIFDRFSRKATPEIPSSDVPIEIEDDQADSQS